MTKLLQDNISNIPIICGTETEFGVLALSNNIDHYTASSLVVNGFTKAFKNNHLSKWNYSDETPGLDVFGNQYNIGVDSEMKNLVLSNGARFYVDHAHPEYSSPECLTAYESLLADRRGDYIATQSALAASKDSGVEIVLYKNNSDGKDNSYGTHENYLLSRSIEFEKIIQLMLPHLISRQIYTGSGKVGSENSRDNVDFQISQRADFFEQNIGVETTNKRPIINTRDEPHATFSLYRRLHIIAGDANLCDVAQYIKVGITQILLQLLSKNIDLPKYSFSDPLIAVRYVSRDLTCKKNIEGLDENFSALEIQQKYYSLAYEEYKKGNIEGQDFKEIFKWWKTVLEGLETGYEKVVEYVDWAAKYNLLNKYSIKNNLNFDNAKLKAIDLQYHDLRPEKSLFLKCKTKKIIENDEILNNLFEPPQNTRAYFRGMIISKYSKSIESINWDNILVRKSDDKLVSIPMLNPHLGTSKMVKNLIESSNTIDDLLEKIGG